MIFRSYVVLENVSPYKFVAFMDFSLIWTILAGTNVVYISGIGCIRTFSALGLGAPAVRDWDAVDLLGGRGDALLEVGAEQTLLLLRPFADVVVVVDVEAVLERVSGQRQGGRSVAPAYYAVSCSDMAIGLDDGTVVLSLTPNLH